ncbi:DUF1328 family protein [Motiliproteus sp. MSK22-1]|uniref:DUF1328 family protein n=1 Tax=Motiliproteus sp. MSK22-1 TaxID=1897630 RepID=UPI0009759E6B|nr:DUF1328 family protein [Motiliproteus sp. MSK22-1]
MFWVLICFFAAMSMGALGFTGLAGAWVGEAELLFYIFLILLLVLLLLPRRRPPES